MTIPKLRKQPQIKSAHGISWTDKYAYVDQKNIFDVLKDTSKLLPEIRKYLEENNKHCEHQMVGTKDFREKLVEEFKSRIKLDDTSLKFKEIKYYYWTKTTKKGNYSIMLRQRIDDKNNIVEECWNGDEEKKSCGSEFFSVGDIEISWNEELLGYSLDLKGSEEYTIYIRKISDKKLVTKEIQNTSSDIQFSLNDKFVFYTQLDSKHRPKKIFRHKIGSKEKDLLIYSEDDDRFFVSLYLTSDYKYYVLTSSDHTTTEQYFFASNEEHPKPKLVHSREAEVKYSIDSWQNYFYLHTNKGAKDYKICRTKNKSFEKWEDYVPAKKDVLIGGFTMLNEFMIRGEQSNALTKLFVRNLKTDQEEELTITDEKIINPGVSLMQKDTNTTKVYIGYDSMKTPGKSYEYDLIMKEKKLVKEVEIPSRDHNPNDYILERLHCKSHDNEDIPISLIYHKDIKVDGSAKLLLYAYGAYGNSIFGSFSATKLSLLKRGIIYAIAHVRGGREKGSRWWDDGKLLKKKNTFFDYIACAKYLIEKKYTYKGGIIFLGGSAGGLLGGSVANLAGDLFLSMILTVPFVDVLTTNLNEELPLTPSEFLEIGRSKMDKEHFEYIKSYSPYEQIQKQKYPHMLVHGSLSDSRVLITEPTKYVAKLRDLKTDNNLLLYKVELEAGHSGKTGRDNALEELSFDFAFMLKTAGIIN